ncbi:MAG TPA: hypothetical protein VHF26_15615, partial [Trebonia sp.]|nr:hypothetical protein [Trebonia sp.]
MRTNAYRDEEEYYDEYDTSGNTVWRRRDEDASARPPDDRDYWRRRFLILSAGVVALGACAFLFPGAHRAPARTSASVRASMSAAAERQSLPPAAYGSAWSSPTPTDSPRPAPRLSASPAAAKPA